MAAETFLGLHTTSTPSKIGRESRKIKPTMSDHKSDTDTTNATTHITFATLAVFSSGESNSVIANSSSTIMAISKSAV